MRVTANLSRNCFDQVLVELRAGWQRRLMPRCFWSCVFSNVCRVCKAASLVLREFTMQQLFCFMSRVERMSSAGKYYHQDGVAQTACACERGDVGFGCGKPNAVLCLFFCCPFLPFVVVYLFPPRHMCRTCEVRSSCMCMISLLCFRTQIVSLEILGGGGAGKCTIGGMCRVCASWYALHPQNDDARRRDSLRSFIA